MHLILMLHFFSNATAFHAAVRFGLTPSRPPRLLHPPTPLNEDYWPGMFYAFLVFALSSSNSVPHIRYLSLDPHINVIALIQVEK